MIESRELRQKLGELADQFRKLIDVGQEKRSAEQNAEMDRIEKDIASTEKEIRRVDEQEQREQRLKQPVTSPVSKPDPAQADVATAEARAVRVREFRTRHNADRDLRAAMIASAMAGDLDGLQGDERVPVGVTTPEYRRAFGRYLSRRTNQLSADELRALSAGTGSEGGYTIPVEDFQMTLLKRIDEETVIQGLATKFTVAQAQSLGIPALAANPADADWTVELGTGNEDSTMAMGKRELRPWPLAKRIKVSEKLLRASPLGAEAIVRDRLAYIQGITRSKAFNTGDGVNKPLGIYTADANGIPTGQDQAVFTSSALDPDKIIAAYYALRPVYRNRARWHFSPTVLGAFRKLKTTSPIAYLWQPGLALGAPSTFLGSPYAEDEFAPSAVTSGLYIAVLGDFSFYHVVDALDARIQRLDELYAETGQVGFISRSETDAQPVLSEAFVRLICS